MQERRRARRPSRANAADQILSQHKFDIDEILVFRETTTSTALGQRRRPIRPPQRGGHLVAYATTAGRGLMDYEVRLDDFAARHPQSILCLYDIDDLGAGVVFEAMKVHPQIWLSGLELENTFYEAAG